MYDERKFYTHVMGKTGSFQIYLPKKLIDALEIKDRDELEVTVKKTGITVEKTNRGSEATKARLKKKETPPLDRGVENPHGL